MDVEDFCTHLSDQVDLLVLCNPNNPTSTAITCGQMRRILDACLQYGIFVMVDETYVEFAPQRGGYHLRSPDELLYESDYPAGNFQILRGAGTAAGICGHRQSGSHQGHQHQEKFPGPSTPWRKFAGRLMFPDDEYIRLTRELISSERDRMFQELSGWDSVKVYQPMANFMLVRIRKPDVSSQDLFDHCIRQGLMIRDCSTFPFLDNRYVRFCFMNPEENDRLLKAFREKLEG